MKHLMTFATTLILATYAHALPGTDNQSLDRLNLSPLIYLNAFQGHAMPQACTDANFTPEQMTAMREEIYQSDRRAVTLKANLKIAAMDYAHVIMDVASPLTDAQAASGTVSTSVAALVSNKLELANTLLYTILTTDQRASSITCFWELEKMAMEEKLAELCAKLPPTP